MITSSRYLALAAAVVLFSLLTPAFAGDIGDPKDIQQVRKIVPKKFGKILHISVSHEWALCTTYSDQSDLSVVLRRTGANWKVVASDGGAYVAETLKPLGVPSTDIPPLLKAYQ